MPIDELRLAGGGKGGSSGVSGTQEDPNTLAAKANARVLDLVSEGEIGGLIGGAKGIYLNDTPLENADGTFNFAGVSWVQRYGLPDQPSIPGGAVAETAISVGVAVIQAVPITRSVNGADADSISVVVSVPSLQALDKKNNRVTGTSVSYTITLRKTSDNSVVFQQQYTMTGKTTSEYQRAHYIKLPGRAFYTVTVSRDTPDNTSQDISNQTYFAGYTETVEGRMSYPDSALVGLQIDAQQFGSSVPTRAYRLAGIKCKVPTNYDPVNHVYTSPIWDGTFKTASTDDPAWIMYDLLTNDRYGLGDDIAGAMVDKWALFDISKYCNETVPDGYGGTEPRFTFNGVINNQDDAYAALSIIASSFQGMIYYRAGSLTATQDSPQDPLIDVNNTNVVNGQFSYERTARKARATVVYVTYNDPNNLQKAAVEVVEDFAGIARYGIIRRDITLPGCKSRSMAIRMARWILFTEQYETETITYQCYADHLNVKPGSIVRVHDDNRLGFEGGGRIVSVSGNVFTLDQQFQFLVGVTYKLCLILPDGSPEEIPIVSPGAVTTNTVTLTASPTQTQLPGYTWAILSSDLADFTYRVLTVKEDTTTGVTLYEVTALQYEPQKFDVIEQGITFNDVPRTRINPVNVVQPVPAANVKEIVEASAQIIKHHLDVSWSPSPDPYLAGYIVSYTIGDGVWVVAGRTTDLNLRISDVGPGDYKVRVTALNSFGFQSRPIEASFTINTTPYTGPTITGLRMTGENVLTPNTFKNKDVTFEWRKSSTVNNYELGDEPNGADSGAVDSLFKDYRVQVYDSTGSLLRTEYVYDPTYTYTFEKNYIDTKAVPVRSFTIAVSYRALNNTISPETRLAVSNPAPVIDVIQIGSTPYEISLPYTIPTDPDFVGLLVWAHAGSTFTPSSATKVFEGPGTPRFTTVPLTNYWIFYAAYDVFGQTGLNVVGPLTFTTPSIADGDLDHTPPAIPATPTLTSTVSFDTGGDQALNVLLKADWTANTDTDLSGYDVEIKEGSGTYVAYSSGSNHFEWRVKANQAYSVRIRAVDWKGNRSGYSTVATITTTKDSTPPSAPTSLAATNSLSSAFLTWTNPSDGDLAQVQVYESTSNSSGTASLIATVNAQASAQGGFTRTGMTTGSTRYYWVKAVDTSGNVSGFNAVGGVSVTFPQISGPDISANSITTNHMSAGSINADRIQAGTITGSMFNTGTSLPGTITVGATGVSIGTIQTQANDPAARVNANSTTILPGKILISGSTTLSNWISGGDNVSIDGGAIYANSINANKLNIGARGVQFTGVQFQCNPSTGVVTWTAGFALYIDDNNAATAKSISSGSATYSGSVIFIYYTKGGTSFSTTSDPTTSQTGNNIIVCTYTGGGYLVATYGQTIIDGSNITTDSITATQIASGAISTNELAANAVTAVKINANEITVDKLVVNSAIVPARASMSSYGAGVGSGSYATVLTCSVYLPVAGVVEVLGSMNQSFSSIPSTWGVQVVIDGNVVSQPHGTYPGDAIPLSGSYPCAAGTRTVSILWAAWSSITLVDGLITVKGFPNTT